MNKEERRRYVFAQLGSLPNTFQYIEVTNYIKDIENENTNLKQALNEIREYINDTNKREGLSQYVDTGKKLNDILQMINKVLGDDEK